MTTYLLDGNILSELEDRKKPQFDAITARLDDLDEEDEVVHLHRLRLRVPSRN